MVLARWQKKIKNGFDMVPIQVGKISNNYFVLNGHHRIRSKKEYSLFYWMD
jgi:hypothetical protein